MKKIIKVMIKKLYFYTIIYRSIIFMKFGGGLRYIIMAKF